MALFDEKISSQLKSILNQMQDEVKIVYFTQEIECQTCRDGRRFVAEIASLSSKLNLDTYNLVTDKEKAALYRVDKVPAILLLDKDGNDTRIKYYGIPGGYEINSFLSAILAVSGRREAIPMPIRERIARLDKEIHLQVFVSLGCPHCPNAVLAAHLLALESPKIRADMVESTTFIHLSIRYAVSGVPKTIINDTADFVGAQPIDLMLDLIEKA